MSSHSSDHLINADFTNHILDLACTIQAIPAPTFNEAQRAAYFLEQFHTLGLQDVKIDSVGNVLARLPGYGSISTGNRASTRPLLLSAHMDTVHPMETPLKSTRQEGRIIGPGIGDNALGLAAVLGLAHLLKEKEIHLPGDLWLAINVGEEGLGDLRGIQAIVNRFGAVPLAYLVVEGMGLGTILHRGLGVERYKISVHTPGGHSWVDFGQPSAIHEICKLVNSITRLSLPKSPCTTLNVGVIHGGNSVNSIAALAWLELDLRSEDRTALATLVHQVRQICESAQRPGITVQIERIGKRLAGQLPPNHPLVELASSVLSEIGVEAHLDIASTDANLPLSRGYPSICVAITYGNNAHTSEEYILTEPVSQGLRQLFLLITRAWEKLG